MDNDNSLTAALRYVTRRGWAVFPVPVRNQALSQGGPLQRWPRLGA